MMRNLLYILAVILVIAWAIGLFVYSVATIIHILLVIAFIAFAIGFMLGRKKHKNRKAK